LSGPWEVSFDPKWGGPAKATFATLEDWSNHVEDGIKYYSGTATYRRVFSLQSSVLSPRVYLDLGRVAVMAQVKVNGRDCGIVWTEPYRVEITSAVKPGENALEISVANLWPNRLIGDEQVTEESERNPGGNLKSWPAWIAEGKPSSPGRFTFSTWRLWKKDDVLLESGLLGPVRILSDALPR
jgi:hypothetical protein